MKSKRGGSRTKKPLPVGVHTFHQGIRFQLHPTPEQAERLRREMGVRRHVYNWTVDQVEANSAIYQAQRDAGIDVEERVEKLQARALYQVFKSTGLPDWWEDASPSVFTWRKAIDDAIAAQDRFVAGLTMFPRHKSKKRDRDRVSFQGTDCGLTDAGVVRLPTLGRVPVAGHPPVYAKLRRLLRRGRAKLMRVTVTKHADGTYWLSASVERQARTQPVHPQPVTATSPHGETVALNADQLADLYEALDGRRKPVLDKAGRTRLRKTPLTAAELTFPVGSLRGGVLGVDRGILMAAVAAHAGATTLEDAAVLPGMRPRRDAQAALTRAQQQMARRHILGRPLEEQSAGYHRAKARAARLHRKVAAQRANHLHLFTKQLVRQAPVICVETLSTTNLVKNRHLAAAIAEQGWGELVRQLRYKAAWAGGLCVDAPRFLPSSKTCSGCFSVIPKLSLDQRTYTCSSCDLVIDRDLNAARVLAIWAEHHLGVRTTLPTPPGVTGQDADAGVVLPGSGTPTQGAGQVAATNGPVTRRIDRRRKSTPPAPAGGATSEAPSRGSGGLVGAGGDAVTRDS